MAVSVILPAAGSGKRFGGELPKQFIELAGKPILVHTLLAFERCAAVDAIAIAAHPSYIDEVWEFVQHYGISKVAACVEGGSERQHSIMRALATPAVQHSDIVLVHDAVRPFVECAFITALVEAAQHYRAVVPGLPPKETIKEVDAGGTVLHTHDRSMLRAVQTPQGFRRDVLQHAYEYAHANNFLGTDDASVVEYAGYAVHVTQGREENIKITTPFDMLIAELLVQQRTDSSVQ